jgi:hypothetical protein
MDSDSQKTVWDLIYHSLTADQNVWIGGNDQDVDGTFVWPSGLPLTGGYENWKEMGPDGYYYENCIMLGPTGEWDDQACVVKLDGVLCMTV